MSLTRRGAIALMVAALLTACSSGSGGSHATATTSPDSVLPFMVPTYLPVTFSVRNGAVQPLRHAHAKYAVALGVPISDGVFGDVVLATVEAATADRPVAPNEQNTPVDIGGTKARLHDGPLIGSAVDWFANGLAVSVATKPGATSVVLAVARALRLPAGGDASKTMLAAPPDGYRVIDEARVTPDALEASEAINLAGSPGLISVYVVATSIPLIFVVGGGDRVTPLTVRGHAGLASVRTRSVPGSPPVSQTTIAWYERPGVAVNILGDTAVSQLTPIAEGLRTVTAREWRGQVPLATTSS